MEERSERTFEVVNVYQDERDTIISAVIVIVVEYCKTCKEYHKDQKFVIFTN